MFRFVTMFFFFYFGLSNAMAHPELKVVEQSMSDTVISAKIDAKLAEKGEINPFKLHVSTKDGVVTLRGTVPDKQQCVDVLRLVKSTSGVQGVEIEHLKIKQVNTPITDAYITAKAEAAVLQAKVFDDESIPLVGVKAHTENGIVSLSGFVKQAKSIAFITKRVSSVHGVKKVYSKLKVVSRSGLTSTV